MASSNNANYGTRGGAPGSAGDNAVKVDRPNESLSGTATTDNVAADGYSPLVQTRGNFDSGKATGAQAVRQFAVIDTSETSRLDLSQNVKRGKSTVW